MHDADTVNDIKINNTNSLLECSKCSQHTPYFHSHSRENENTCSNLSYSGNMKTNLA